MIDKLKSLRTEIDLLDAQMLELLTRRGRLAQEVGHVKQEANAPILRPDREAQIIQRLQGLNQGPLSGSAIESIFREIISACRGLERRLQVAYLGPTGTFTEQAVYAHLGHQVDVFPQPTILDVFRAVESSQHDLGVVPVENSSEGSVNQTLDKLLTSSLKICGEVALPIHHILMTRSGTMDGVLRISAHPQALAQCNAWLNQHYPALERVAVTSNAEAARLAAEDATLAAIAGETAQQHYGLQAVASHIQDDPHNRTRFVIIGTLEPGISGHDRTSLILSVANRAGAVYDLLQPLAQHKVSMTRFESRPARTGKWEYHFYIDIDGHREQPHVAAALEALEKNAAFCKVLGSYPVK
ncbi:MAG: prephenate dehydratase [Burkholderiaceae bacterium]|nr:MAG: prephenate dehydratase [Burkholderiaceae bacterium]